MSPEIPEPPPSGDPPPPLRPRPLVRTQAREYPTGEFVPPASLPVEQQGPPLGARRRVMLEAADRMCETLRLWVPQPQQVLMHSSQKHVRLALGGNRGGKTATGAIEAARAILGCDPYNKYPKRDGTAVFVSKDNDTVGTTFHEKLFRPGAIKLIRDEETRLWRSVRPDAPYDEAYREKWKDAPPIIPERLCHRRRNIAWEDKKKGIIRRFWIPSTGWQVYVFSGESTPKTGYAIDLAWMDEEARDERWYPELEMRTPDRHGRIMITATPLAGSAWMGDIYARWEAGDKYVDVIPLEQDANAHISMDAKKAARAGLSADEYEVRVKGKFARAKQMIFPEFDQSIHGINPFAIPEHWTRYIGIDPGNVPASAIFVAVPPPDDAVWGKHVIVYDELVVMQSSAEIFAKRLKERVGDQRIERFIIDMRFARQSEAGSGMTTLDHYRDAFANHRLESERQGADFTAGTDEPESRIEAIHSWLRLIDRPMQDVDDVESVSKPTLYFFQDRLPIWCDQMRRYIRKRDTKGNLSDQIVKRNDHLIDALGYVAHLKPQWVAPGGGSFLSRYKQFQAELLRKAASAIGGFSFSARG